MLPPWHCDLRIVVERLMHGGAWLALWACLVCAGLWLWVNCTPMLAGLKQSLQVSQWPSVNFTEGMLNVAYFR
jgi:hypothetical protein